VVRQNFEDDAKIKAIRNMISEIESNKMFKLYKRKNNKQYKKFIDLQNKHKEDIAKIKDTCSLKLREDKTMQRNLDVLTY
jgi:Cu2+-containing amine oxidase